MKRLQLKMKRLSLISLCLFASVYCYAGKDDIMAEAIRNGIAENFCYRITNSFANKVKAQKMQDFLYDNGYTVTDIETDSKGYLIRMDFIKYDDYYKYVYYHLSNHKTDIESLKNKGKVYLLYKKPIYGTRFREDKLIVGYEDALEKEYREVSWSGDVVNGLIVGTGYGFQKLKTGWLYFEGTFVAGIPASDTSWKTYHFPGWNYKSGNTIDANNLISRSFENPDPAFIAKKMEFSRGELKAALKERLSVINSDYPEKCILEYVQLIKQGKAPILSQDIGLDGGFFKADVDAAKKRVTLEALAKSNTKAEEALKYMNLIDGLYFSLPSNKESALKIMNRPICGLFISSNYWKSLEHAATAAKELKSLPSAKGIYTKLSSAEKTINTWNKTIFAKKNKIIEEGKKALGSIWNEVLEDSKKTSYNTSSSSSSSKKSESVDVEDLKITDIEYEFTSTSWYEKSFTSDKYKEIRMWAKGDKKNAVEGRIYKTKDGTYYTDNGPLLSLSGGLRFFDSLENAILDEYAVKEYGKHRKTGRK